MSNRPERTELTDQRTATTPPSTEAGPRWVDSHCHLQLFDRPLEVLQRARALAWMVIPGIDADSSLAGLELAMRLERRAFAAAGLHPDNAQRWPRERHRILDLIPKVTAVGETGLDFYRNLAPRDSQITAFRELLDAAGSTGKPVIVHCRDAFREVFDILDATSGDHPVIMHCWSGGPNWTRRFLDLGVLFSFAGPVLTGPDDMIRRGAAIAGPERTLIETDGPHLCPSRHTDRVNEPANIPTVGEALGLVWGMTTEEVAGTTARTARLAFFGESSLSSAMLSANDRT